MSRPRRLRFLAPLPLLASLLGCGAEPPVPDERVATVSDAIAGGYEDAADRGVVAFFYAAAGALCSGSLISPNVVLTARHCVSPTLNEVNGGVACSKTSFGDLGSPFAFFVTTEQEITVANAGDHLVREVVGLPVDDALLCGQDAAILILKEPVDPGDATPIEPRVDTPLVAGEGYSAIGFGATADGGVGAGKRRRRDDLFVDCVGAECSTTAVTESEWIGDTGICSGDSGGPAVDLAGHVVGITSRGAAGCDSPVYGSAYWWGQWLKNEVVYAAGLAELEPAAWTAGADVQAEHSAPIGEACTTDADCYTGRCLTEGGESYCTRGCTEAAPCPPDEDYTCSGIGVCQKVRPPAPPAAAPPAEEDSGCSVAEAGRDARSGVAFLVMAIALACARRRRR